VPIFLVFRVVTKFYWLEQIHADQSDTKLYRMSLRLREVIPIIPLQTDSLLPCSFEDRQYQPIGLHKASSARGPQNQSPHVSNSVLSVTLCFKKGDSVFQKG
jgi:hypothetical protein